MRISKHVSRLFVGIIGLTAVLAPQVFAGTLTNFSHTADTWEAGAVATHTFTFTTATDIPGDGSRIYIGTSGFHMSFYYGTSITVNGGGDILYSYSGLGYVASQTLIPAGSVVVVTTRNPNTATAGAYSLIFRTEDSSQNPLDTISAPSFDIVNTRRGGYSPPLPDYHNTTPPAPEPEPTVVPVAKPETTKQPEPPKFVEPVDTGVKDIPETKSVNLPEKPAAPYIDSYIKLGADNNAEDVVKLEKFLNVFENARLTEDGVYEKDDYEAVKLFQIKHTDKILAPWGTTKATGYVYIKTRELINALWNTYMSK